MTSHEDLTPEQREIFETLRKMDYHNVRFSDDGGVSVDFWPRPKGEESERPDDAVAR